MIVWRFGMLPPPPPLLLRYVPRTRQLRRCCRSSSLQALLLRLLVLLVLLVRWCALVAVALSSALVRAAALGRGTQRHERAVYAV
jgi:hypothetical protein